MKSVAGYDIIGDVHGCADALKRLLGKLNYQNIDGVYQHSQRQAIFAGDIIDRGPSIREALAIVRAMVDAGTGIMLMGNHEFDAIAYHTATPPHSNRSFLREHTDHHYRLIQQTLTQFSDYPEEWSDYIEWFKRLPLFLEFDNFRVVHACWDQAYIDEFKRRYGGNQINNEFLMALVDEESFEWKFVSRLTRGRDIPLPEGAAMTSAEGFERRSFRARFWGRQPKTYGELAFQPDPLPDAIAQQPIDTADDDHLIRYGRKELPLFIGHYWLSGRPQVIADNLACLDYSAVKYGRLVAYSIGTEKVLSDDNFTWVHVDTP